MTLQVGWVYKFNFIDYFSQLNGVYTLARTYTYAELLTDDIILKDILYSEYKVPNTQYIADLPKIQANSIYKLVSTQDTTKVIYAPECIFGIYPVFSVKQYSKLVLAIPIGVYPDQDKLSAIKNNIQEELQASLGFADTPMYIETSRVYLTDEEYQEKTADRDAYAKTIINYFSENVTLQATIDKQKSKIKALENIIKSISVTTGS